MRFFSLIICLLTFLATFNTAQAFYTVHIEDDGMPITMHVDMYGRAHFPDILSEGDIYYASSKSVLYYKPKGDEFYYAVVTRPLEQALPSYKTIRYPQDASDFQRELGYGVEQWDFRLNGLLCKRIFGSKKFSKRVRFSMNDFNRVNLGLSYLLGTSVKPTCRTAAIPKAAGMALGFPMREEAVSVGQKSFKVMSIVETPKIDRIPFPALDKIKPLNPKVHIELMKTRLTIDSLSAYKRTEMRLHGSDELKVNALRNLINSQRKQIRIVPPEGFEKGVGF